MVPGKCRTRILALGIVLAAATTAGAADQVVGNCANDTELRSKFDSMQSGGGGTLSFSCGPSTIALTSVLVMTKATVVNGGNKITLSGNNSSRIFQVLSGPLTLQNIVLSNGFDPDDGGAIVTNSGLSLDHATIQNSTAGGNGGAISTYGPLSIDHSILAHNGAANGGAIFSRFEVAQVTITNSEIYDNKTNDAINGVGGAVLLRDGADVVISGSDLHDNTARAGGAIYNAFSNSSVSVQDSSIHENKALENSGGGIYSNNAVVAITDSMVWGNTASILGGGVFIGNSAYANIVNSTFLQNNGGTGGGGVAVANSVSIFFVNDTFTGNAASVGGALYCGDCDMSLTNVTIYGSFSDPSSGSGIQSFSDSPGRTVALENTIVGGSAEGKNCYQDGYPVLVSFDGNLSDDDSCKGFLNKPHDKNEAAGAPMLGDIGHHGSKWLTRVPQPGSPAVDGGVLPDAPSTDARGVSRPQGAAIDIGAIEVASCEGWQCGDSNRNQSLSASDALFALKAAVGTTTCPLWLCDYDGSALVSASDALAILRSSVGQSVPPACPAGWDCVL